MAERAKREARPLIDPFPGLRPFEPGEEHLFFGREEATVDLLRKLRTHRFLAVIGSSGGGKSSLVRSGLIPSLHSGFMSRAGSRWRVAILRPGQQPFFNLASALNEPDALGPRDRSDAEIAGAMLESTLRSSSVGLNDAVLQARLPDRTNLLVLVDQFEELFRFKKSGGVTDSRYEARAFVRLLLEAAQTQPSAVYIVLTMRSDYIGDCMEFPGLPEAINRGMYLVPRLTRDQLRQAITGPVAVGGARIAPRLVQRLLNDVGDDPDQLPILQHALMRTWQKWREGASTDGAIDPEHYRAIGTMSTALAKHAEEAWSELANERERQIAEKLFKALTDTASDPRGIRRPCPLAEICDVSEAATGEVARVVDRFRSPGRSFLMPPAEVELEPDSVLDISHESLMRVWPRLRDWSAEEKSAARFYLRLSEAARYYEEKKAGLWRGEELPLARDWEQRTRPSEAWAARYDKNFRRAMRFLAESRRVRDLFLAKRRRRRLLGRAAAAAAAVLILVALAGWNVKERRLASRQQGMLRAASLLDTARGIEDVQTQALLLAELRDEPIPPGGVRTAQDIAERLDASEPQRLGPFDGTVVDAAFVGDRPRVFLNSKDGCFRILVIPDSVASEPRIVHEHEGRAVSAAVSPDGTRAATADFRDAVYLWALGGDSEPTRLAEPAAHRVAFGPAGDQVAAGSLERRARVWRLRSSAHPVDLLHEDVVNSVAFSPDGDRLVTTAGQSAWLWSEIWSPDGPRSERLGRHQDNLADARFSHDGKSVVTASDDGIARVWRLDNPEEPILLRGHTDAVKSAVFSKDDSSLLTASSDGTVRLWNADGSGEPIVLEGPGKLIGAGFNRDSSRVITVSEDNAVQVWRVGWADLLAFLRSRTTSCLKDFQRVSYLGEPWEVAKARSADCERSSAG